MSLEDVTTWFNFFIIAPVAWVAQKAVNSSNRLTALEVKTEIHFKHACESLDELKKEQTKIHDKLDDTNEKLDQLLGRFKTLGEK